MKAQKIALVVMGVIALVLLMVVLSTVGSLSSIADQRETNDSKIAEIELKKAACESAWNSLSEQLKKKQEESLSYVAMERAQGRLEESVEDLAEEIKHLKEQIAEQSAEAAHEEEILAYLKQLAVESSIFPEESETLPPDPYEEDRE
ncbi:MAG: hypothetical protein J6T47_02225 [Lachnospiraceae bacterium]|nr:hypothetical protein [Lachnospiraceae bacterium]